MKRLINLTVNQRKYELAVSPNMTLADMLRKELGLTGTKKGCDAGDCGTCTVILDGLAVHSCLTLAVQANGKQIRTIEGLRQGDDLHPIQKAFVEEGAVQCGFCTPGFIMRLYALLKTKPDAEEEEIREALSENLCRCTGYEAIWEAALLAQELMREGRSTGPVSRP